jgi:hypothetical protein
MSKVTIVHYGFIIPKNKCVKTKRQLRVELKRAFSRFLQESEKTRVTSQIIIFDEKMRVPRPRVYPQRQAQRIFSAYMAIKEKVE